MAGGGTNPGQGKRALRGPGLIAGLVGAIAAIILLVFAITQPWEDESEGFVDPDGRAEPNPTQQVGTASTPLPTATPTR